MTENENAYVSTRPTIHVNGRKRDDFNEAVMNLHINQPLSGVSHAEVKLVNWGMRSGESNSDFAFLDVNLGDTIEVLMGEDESKKVFSGEVTAIEELYGEGPPQLVLLIQDKLHHLARIRKSRTFDEMSIDDVIHAIASETGFESNINISSVSGTFHQLNESNLAFMLRLLSPLDIALRLEGNTLRVRAEEHDQNPFVLNAQDNANNVRMLVDLNHQPTVAHVAGFNPASDVTVNGHSSTVMPTASYKTAADHLNALGWEGDDNFPQPFAQTQAAADAYASGQFNKRARHFINGEVRCRGEATLKSGREVELTGVTERLRGKYQVVNCIHSFNGTDGFETRVMINRADWNV